MPLSPGSVWLDAQGAQNQLHLDRGIPRYVSEHVRALLAVAPDAIGAVALNAAQPLTSNLGFLLGTGVAVRRGVRQAPPEPPPALYHVMSAFELERSLDELWPDWARRPEVATVVTLYDLIPLVFDEHYLRDPAARARYLARANLVRAADHVLAISQATADDARELLGVAPERITVVDAGVAGTLRAPTQDARRALARRFPQIHDGFMFYVGGFEFRKNLERLIEAYGLVDPRLRARHQLVITCKLQAGERAHLEGLAADAGLRQDDLVLTGYVTDAELAALSGAARLFVFASFYEGSGLPILEAMAAGLPVAASRTSTSPEILGDTEATFDPFDPHDMARVLAATVADDAVLDSLRARSRERVAHYTWEHVARRTLDGYAAALGERGRRAPRARRRLALVTPWPPERSGIADYNARLVRALAHHVDVDVIVREERDDHLDLGVRGVRLIPYEDHERWARSLRTYDRVLYCMGNSDHHGWIYEALMARPGVVVAHDVRLTGFYGWYAGQELPEDPIGRLAERIEAMYGDRVDWGRWLHRAPTPEEQEALGLYMTQEVQEQAHAAIVHSRYAAEVLALDRPPDARHGPPVHVVPHAMPPLRVGPRPRWSDPMIVSFGVLSRVKGLQTLIEAFARVVERHPRARLILAGHGDPDEVARWNALAEELGVSDSVDVPGYVTPQQYEDLLGQAWVAVQLRLTSNGEASGAVANNLAAGLPTIVTDIGWFAELPRDAVVHVPHGVAASRLAEEIGRLLTDPEHGAAVAAAGRRHAEATGFPAVARRYLDALWPRRPAAGAAAAAVADLAPAPVTVVLITHNRRENVRLALAALGRQTTRDFAVVVADEGSTDGTRELVDALAVSEAWAGRLRWVAAGSGPTGCSRPRNVGAANAAPGSTLLAFMDADVLLADGAIDRLLALHRGHPGSAIFATVHWLPPLDLGDVEVRVREAGAGALVAEVPRGRPRRVEGTIVGPDTRGAGAFNVSETPVRPELALFTFAAVPVSVWRRLGGFDEQIRGYGYEDMEMGIRLARLGASAVMAHDLVALHVWHAKHDWDRLSLQNERNLDYVLRKHGLDATSDEWADWSVWWHYHADRGGRVVRDPEGALWAVDRGNRVRLGLPSEDWLERLGHGAEDVTVEDVSGLRVAGEALELSLP